jgi:hypothetical protein
MTARPFRQREESTRGGNAGPGDGTSVPHKGWSALVTMGALLTAAAHMLWPDVEIDEITLGLGVIALVPWLSAFVESLKWGDLEVKLRQAEEIVQGAAASWERKANLPDAAPVGPDVAALAQSLTTTADDELLRLAEQYNRMRKELPYGPERTARLDQIVQNMITIAGKRATLDPRPLIKESDSGHRLAGYAILYALPRLECLPDLVETVTDPERAPFEQYWGILTLGRMTNGVHIQELDRHQADRLYRMLGRMDAGTDRAFELRRVLQRMEAGSRTPEE